MEVPFAIIMMKLDINYRMGGLEAASLTVKLKYLEGWNNRRRGIASMYQKGIVNPKTRMQQKPVWADGIYHLFVVTTEDRDAFVKHLADNNIIAAFHYPVPCHLQKAYSWLKHKEGDFTNSEYLSGHCVSLPMYAELSDEEVNKVIAVINNY